MYHLFCFLLSTDIFGGGASAPDDMPISNDNLMNWLPFVFTILAIIAGFGALCWIIGKTTQNINNQQNNDPSDNEEHE